MEDNYEKLEKLGEGTYGKVQRFILLPAMVAVLFTDCYALVQIPQRFCWDQPIPPLVLTYVVCWALAGMLKYDPADRISAKAAILNFDSLDKSQF